MHTKDLQKKITESGMKIIWLIPSMIYPRPFVQVKASNDGALLILYKIAFI